MSSESFVQLLNITVCICIGYISMLFILFVGACSILMVCGNSSLPFILEVPPALFSFVLKFLTNIAFGFAFVSAICGFVIGALANVVGAAFPLLVILQLDSICLVVTHISLFAMLLLLT